MKYLKFLILISSLMMAQSRIGDWQSITSPLNIRSLQAWNGSVYCATDGGLLLYNFNQDEFVTLTNLDGLSTTDLMTVAIDSGGGIWVGGASPDGSIDRLDLDQPLNSISLDLDLTEIRDFAINDSMVFVVFQQNQDMGLIQFDKQGGRYQYRDVYKNWPAGIQTITGVALFGSVVYVGTNQGLWQADMLTGNLKNPDAWTRPFPEITEQVLRVRTLDDILLFQIGYDVFSVDTRTGILSMIDDHAPGSVIDFLPLEADRLLYLTPSELIERKNEQTRFSMPVPRNVLTALTWDSVVGWVAGSIHGLALIDTARRALTWKIPNAPVTNGLTAATVMSDGRVVVASSKGLAVRESEGWRNIVESTDDRVVLHSEGDYRFYLADSIPVDFGGFVADLEEGPDGLLYCAIRGTYPEPIRHGGGVIILDIDHPEAFTLIDTSHLDYYTTATNSNPYMVVKDVAFDRNQALWIADTYATKNKRPIQVRDSQGEWGGYYADSLFLLPLTPVTLGFDAWDRVWVGSFREGDEFTRSGLYVLRYSGSPAHPDSYNWIKIDGLIDDTIWSLGITSENRLYYLTPRGLNYLELQYNPNNPVLRGGAFTYFPNISYGDGAKIRLDSRENVWTVSPSDGIYVLLANTTYWPDQNPDLVVEGITQETTPLLSNEVTDIAFDSDRGLAYITSKRGLNVLKIPFTNPRKTYASVRIFPSPYRIPADRPLVIDRLPDLSTAMIMTLTGQVIRTLSPPNDNTGGDQLFWDGRNEAGNWVETGVYLVALYTPDGHRNVQKIAVIRN